MQKATARKKGDILLLFNLRKKINLCLDLTLIGCGWVGLMLPLREHGSGVMGQHSPTQEQPDNHQGIFGIYGDQDCLFTNFGGADGKWDDLSCRYGHDDLLKFVCEIDTGTDIADLQITKVI